MFQAFESDCNIVTEFPKKKIISKFVLITTESTFRATKGSYV